MANLVPERRPARVSFRQSREHFRFDPPNLLLTTLKVAAAVAVVAIAERSTNFTDYNAPKQPVEFQPPNTLLTLLAPRVAPAFVAPPFAQEDWPNPRGSPVRDLTWTQSPEVIPQVVIPPAPAPFEQADWPNPRGSPVRDLTWTQTPKVQQQQIVPADAVAEGQRAHGFTEYFAPKWPVEFQPPNTLALLTQPVAVAEAGARAHGILDYFSKEQPALFDPPNTLALLTRPVAFAGTVKPFLQTEWPNPVLRTPFKESGWSRFANIGDIPVQTTPPAGAEAGRSHGFTDFNAPKAAPQFDPPNTLLGGIPARPTPPPVVSVPFTQEDWPNPVVRTVRLKTPQSFRLPPYDATVTSAVVSTTFPFSQDDWPNPVRRVSYRDFSWSQSPKVQQIVLEPAGTTFPFSLLDHPNPILRTPFLESGWVKFANVGDIPAATPPVIVVGTPFNQDDWPNPVLRKVRIKTPESFRPAPYDATVTTVASTTFPFSQADWPNPVRRISPKEWGFTRFANVSDIPQRFITPAPLDQTDWPNPLRPWVRDLTWSQSPKVEQIVPEAASNFPPAFVQTDWPNPVLRTPFNESGWVRFANIGDIPAAAPPPPPPPPVDEVKPSGGRVDHEFKYAIEGRKTYAQKLRDWHIAQEAAEVIEHVALQQAATLEIDEIRNARELKRALRLAKVEDDARYLELLAERRELAKNEEIGALLYKAMRDEEDVLALLMIAAQLL